MLLTYMAGMTARTSRSGLSQREAAIEVLSAMKYNFLIMHVTSIWDTAL